VLLLVAVCVCLCVVRCVSVMASEVNVQNVKKKVKWGQLLAEIMHTRHTDTHKTKTHNKSHPTPTATTTTRKPSTK